MSIAGAGVIPPPFSSLFQVFFTGLSTKMIPETEILLEDNDPNPLLASPGGRMTGRTSASMRPRRVRSEQPGVVGPHFARHTIAREQQPRTDHVYRADNNGRCGRVGQPFPVVHMLAA